MNLRKGDMRYFKECAKDKNPFFAMAALLIASFSEFSLEIYNEKGNLVYMT